MNRQDAQVETNLANNGFALSFRNNKSIQIKTLFGGHYKTSNPSFTPTYFNIQQQTMDKELQEKSNKYSN